MNDWMEYLLGDVAELKYGKAHKSLAEGQIPAYGSGGLMRYVDTALYEHESILIPRKGSLSNIMYKAEPFWTVDTMFYTKLNLTYVFPKFLYYQLKLVDFESLNVGSAVPSLTTQVINAIPIELPTLFEQKSIASILSSLDDKIDLLHRQNKTLEAMAETLFRQWFIEEASEEWEAVKICDVAKINSKVLTKNYPYETINYLDTGSITKGVIANYQNYSRDDVPSRAQRIPQENDVVYSLVRPVQRHYGILSNLSNNTVVSTGFCVITAQTVSPYFLYMLLTLDENVDYFDMIAEASTSTYPSLKPSDIANFEFLMPPSEKLKAFAEIAEAYWQKINSNSNQIQTLTQLRDNLLPKLMSGEISVY